LLSARRRNPDLMAKVFAKVGEPSVDGKYIHWEGLRHREPPKGLDHLGWWFGLKLRRQASEKPVPLTDAGGTPFAFNLSDPLPECLHESDSGARGSIGALEPISNRDNRDQYVTRSSIEESITSSLLEGASATRDIAKAMIREAREPRDRGERMILNNYLTMQEVVRLKDEPLERFFVDRDG